MQSKVFSTNKTLNIRGKLMDVSVPQVMGILNVTPDSFHDGGRFADVASMLQQVENMLLEGAALIDVGGYSTRPGAEEISETEEIRRIAPALQHIMHEFPHAFVSIDTFRSGVARRAVDEGASIINDISGGSGDEKMFETAASLKVPYILMHMRGTPRTMTHLTDYNDLMKDIVDYFHPKLNTLRLLGVKDVVIDPGFGFAKTIEQNFELLRHLEYLQLFGLPILAGLSRKSMIWKTLETDTEGALNGTTSLNTMALSKGASILRVHDVKQAVETVRLFQRAGP